MKTPKIIALLKQIESGKMKTDAAYILDYIMRMKLGVDITQLEEMFMMKSTTILARLSDLEDSGVIFKGGTCYNKQQDSTFSLFYDEPCEIKQSENRAKKRAEKYIKCVNRLLNQFDDIMCQKLKNELKSSLNYQTTLFN